MWVAVVSSLPMGTAAWPCRPGVRLSETPVAFAGAGRASTETGIAFAGENWVFLARFSLALVLPVSMGVVHGRALVLVVSPSPPQCVLSAKKFALRGLVVGVSAKKFALHAQNTPKSPFLRLQGEVFRGWGVGGGVLGELFRGWGVGGGVLGELFRACRPATATSPGPPLPPAPARHCHQPRPATACRPHGHALRRLQHTPYR